MKHIPEIDSGKSASVKLTLTTAGVVRTIAIPSWARGFTLLSDKLIRFALGEDPAANEPEVADNDVAATDLGEGYYALANVPVMRRLPGDISSMYNLRLVDDAGGAVVYISFWGC